MMNSETTNVLRAKQRRGPAWYAQPWWGGDSLSARQYSLLRVLAVANRERLDVVALIFSLASEHRGYYRRLLATLGTRIEAGASLVAALEQTPDALSDEDVLALRLAGESGTWAQTFSELLELRLEDQRAARLRPQLSVAYWLVVLLVCSALFGLLLALIAPTFQAIGREFGLAPPNSFIKLMQFADSRALGLIMLSAVIVILWFSCFRAPRRFFQRRVAPSLFPPVAQQQIVELYRMLAIALDAGRPLTGALSTLARYHFNRSMRNRLLLARNEVEQGADTWQGMAQSRLIGKREADALSEAPSSPVAAWTLRELARKKFVTASRRTAALAILIEPALTLLFGGFVLWVCLAFFQYLVKFISSV